MSLISFFKSSLGFLLGAALGLCFAWGCIRLYFNMYPAPTQQIGDLSVLMMYGLATLAFALLMAILGGIAGVVLVRRFR